MFRKFRGFRMFKEFRMFRMFRMVRGFKMFREFIISTHKLTYFVGYTPNLASRTNKYGTVIAI